jgi:hypothetical protein
VQGSNLRPDDYFTTPAFASRRISPRCSLDWLIAHSRNCLGVRRTVSEGFPELDVLTRPLPQAVLTRIESCLLIAQSSKFLRFLNSYLKLSGFSSIQPHFHFAVSSERSYFKEQESSALPTELTTHFFKTCGKSRKLSSDFAVSNYSNSKNQCANQRKNLPRALNLQEP